jgi:2-phosphosulfolactate phosphatase
MNIKTLLSPLNAEELFFTGKTTVVIDVLRATTTITTALNNGAREVIPVGSIEFAMKVSGNAFGGVTLLGGERNITKISGFQLGNSPLEYEKETVAGKSVILFTTNGTKAIVRGKFSDNLIVCCLNNIKAVAEHLLQLDKDPVILCAGSNGMFCVEDTLCAGLLIKELEKDKKIISLDDASKASKLLVDSTKGNVLPALLESDHGRKLAEKGFEKDIEYAAALNTIDIVPVYSSGTIKPEKIETSS